MNEKTWEIIIGLGRQGPDRQGSDRQGPDRQGPDIFFDPGLKFWQILTPDLDSTQTTTQAGF